eukprot:NODE_65_length_23997_cov_0.327601.p5 type:complete len:384 gc:universal NODE_65_length_23997_cov_0.327601:3543-2392(-)
MIAVVAIFAISFENSVFQLYFNCINRCDLFLSRIQQVLDDYAETIVVSSKIRIDFKMTSLDMIEASDSKVLGFSKPSKMILLDTSLGMYLFPRSLTKQYIPLKDTDSDVYIEIVDRIGRWNFESGDKDFKFVIAHELMHGLGFISSIVTENGISPDLIYDGSPSKDKSLIFSQPTIFDHFITCDGNQLSELIRDYNVCAKYSDNVYPDALKKLSLTFIDSFSQRKIEQYLSAPGSCIFESRDLIKFYVYTANDVSSINGNLISHSIEYKGSNILPLMNPETVVTDKYRGVRSVLPVLKSLGYTSKWDPEVKIKVFGFANTTCYRMIDVKDATIKLTLPENKKKRWITASAVYAFSISLLQYFPHLVFQDYFKFLYQTLHFVLS